MDNIKNDSFYVDKIIKDIEFLLEHTQNISKENLTKDEVLLDSIMFRLIQISECSEN